ncbi:MAG: alkaline phosphatase family protein [Proteobacteria bacterium]|nr:alkaline phosphatase family protein [Pseudomonadota bacterium]
MKLFPRVLALAVVTAAACRGESTTTSGGGGPGTTPTAHASETPKLVVLVVLDQWPEWAFETKRATLVGERGGFARLLAEGEWHVGQHPSAATLTAPGHALLGTGEPTSRSGILANEWYHRDLKRRLHATEDATGASNASWLRVPGLGDSLAASGRGGHAVAVSLKDRAAILPLGHAGTAVWFDKQRLAWVTTGAPPAWLAAHDAAHPIAARMHTVWTPTNAARLATLSGTIDAQVGELGEAGFGPTFPHDPDATKDPAEALVAAPIGNEVLVDVALAAIDGEHLGADAAPDLLVISLSPHDYVGHGWGQESWEMWDLELRLDRELARLLAALDTKVGVGAWSMIVTSDHGASPLPERVHGGRITFEQLRDATNRAASAELGDGEWILDTKYPTVFLAPAILNIKNDKDRSVAIKKVMFALRAFPGIARVELTADIAGHCETRPPDVRVLCEAIDPERSGEIMYLPRPGWVLGEAVDPVATAHGSPHPYDRLVPLLLLPPGRSAHAPETAPRGQLEMTTVADTLAKWLGVTAPRALPR